MAQSNRKISDYSTMELLKAYGIDPKKSLGQNFIANERILEDIVRVADITSEDRVLEIGAGVGNLTQVISRVASQVVAVEIDQRLLPILTDLSSELPNLTVYSGDIMDLDLSSIFKGQTYIAVGNIPYNITSALIRKLVTADSKPARIILTIQKEVAERIVQTAGQYSLLALSVQIYGQPTIVKTIKAGSFYPVPKVDSVVLRIDIYDTPLIESDQIAAFFKIIKAGFKQKRKTLANSLSGSSHLPKDQISATLAEIDLKPMVRAQELSLSQWKSLISALEGLLNETREAQ